MEHHLSKVSIPVYIDDYNVLVGLPEHLEHVAATLRAEPAVASSFDGFVTTIQRALTLADGKLATLGSQHGFAAEMNAGVLSIETETDICLFEEDDLRGVWLDLQSGLVTKRKAGWSIRGGGEPLVSLLSVLPNVRPVQIQRPGAPDPEYAVEPCPMLRGYALAGQTMQQHEQQQHELSWQ